MQTPSARTVVARISSYLERYQDALRFVLADERTRQTVYGADGVERATRAIDGELFLTFLAGDGRWIAIHDVKRVDGEAVTAVEDLRALLQRGEVAPVARRVADRNARYNLGQVRRNFNEPTLPLWLFDRDRLNGVRFGVEPVRPREVAPGATAPALATVTFEERTRPTLVMSERGNAVFSRGTLLVEAATGAIHRTALSLRDGGVAVDLVTEYAIEPRLDLLVPFSFTERYDARDDPRHELILCASRYANYRRFEVTGRIKKA